MPICKKCDVKFPTRVVIEGKERNLSSRKYCLECSPFGTHNTAKLEDSKPVGTCTICKRNYQYKRSAGHRKSICGTCLTSRRRRRTKEKAVEYLGGTCKKCGYSKCFGAFDFHHRDPKEKEFGIGEREIGWKKLVKELDKCDLLCRNCHSEVHDEAL